MDLFLDPTKPALAFPGQGVRINELATSLRNSQGPLVDRLAEITGTTDWDTLDLNDTRIAQPALFVASLLEARSVLTPDSVSVVLGHSVGEITALVFSGALDESVGLELVRQRGEWCAAVSKERPGRMVALMNLPMDRLEWLRRSAIATTGQVLEVAAVNGRSQVVLSGDSASVDVVIAGCGVFEGMAVLLPIGGAFHSPLMFPVVAELQRALAHISFSEPTVPVLSTVDRGVRVSEIEQERQLLAESLIMPVLWHEALEVLRGDGITTVVDSGPGQTLAKLGRRTKTIRFMHVNDVYSDSRSGSS